MQAKSSLMAGALMCKNPSGWCGPQGGVYAALTLSLILSITETRGPNLGRTSGGGMQYELGQSVKSLVDQGFLRRIP